MAELLHDLFIERLRPTLRGTVLRPQARAAEGFTQILLIASGEVARGLNADDPGFAAPLGLLQRRDPAGVLPLGPGTSGWRIEIAPTLMAEVVGRTAESPLLHGLVGRPAVVRPEEDRLRAEYLLPAERIAAEAERPRKGSQMAVVSLLRLLLIAFWREGERDELFVPRPGGEAEILRSFRRLVEMHHRHHLPVADYAPLLGISYDRLHDICRRGLGRSPLQLIHQRLLREARLRLERTDAPIGAISDALGFAEPSRFSHFFRRESGLSPKAWRQGQRQGQRHILAPEASEASFADWP